MNSITKFKPPVIIEPGRYTLKSFEDSLEDLVDLLASLGYSFYLEKDSTQCIDKESLLHSVPEKDTTISVVCRA